MEAHMCNWNQMVSTSLIHKSHSESELGTGREFGLSMFRQLRCLNILRVALIDGPGDESKRCLNLLRQAILCASDITLDALNIEIDGQLKATDGAGMTHVCRDWTQVYAFVRENQRGSTL